MNETKKYTLTVYNTLTHRDEKVEVTREVYDTYRRTGWNIENNDASFFDHEIQISSLIGGEDGAYENFREFIDTENTPDKAVIKKLQIEAVQRACSALTVADKALVQALFYDGMTEREYAERTGIPQTTINYRKMAIIRKLKKLPDFKK